MTALPNPISPQQILRESGARPLSVPIGNFNDTQAKTLAEIGKDGLEKLTGYLRAIFEKSYEVDRLQSVSSQSWAQDSITSEMRGIEAQSKALQLEYKLLSRKDPDVARRLLDHSYYNLCGEKVWNDKLTADMITKNRTILEKVREIIDPKGIQNNIKESLDAAKQGFQNASSEAKQIFETAKRHEPSTVGKWVKRELGIMKTNLTERGHGEMMFRNTLVYLGASMSLFSCASLIANSMSKTRNPAEEDQKSTANHHYMVTAIVGALAAVGAARIGGGKPIQL